MSAAPETAARVVRHLTEAAARLLPGSAASLAAAHSDPSRWRAVTVNAGRDALDPLPEPLAALGDRVETRLTEAPGEKGTELHARWTDDASPGEVADLRAALRESKQLVEVGEVLVLEPIPHGARPATAIGEPLDEVSAQAGREGVL